MLKSLLHFLQALLLDQLIVEFCNKNVEISGKGVSHVEDIVTVMKRVMKILPNVSLIFSVNN